MKEPNHLSDIIEAVMDLVVEFQEEHELSEQDVSEIYDYIGIYFS